jgi:hypothetical protein
MGKAVLRQQEQDKDDPVNPVNVVKFVTGFTKAEALA